MSPTENYSNTEIQLNHLDYQHWKWIRRSTKNLAIENIDALKNLTIELKNNTKALTGIDNTSSGELPYREYLQNIADINK